MHFSLYMDKYNSANDLLNYGENKEASVAVGDTEFPRWQAGNAGNSIMELFVQIQSA